MLNLKAAVNTAIALAICSLSVVSVGMVMSAIPLHYLVGAVMVAALVAAAILMYRSEAARLEFLKKLNKKD